MKNSTSSIFLLAIFSIANGAFAQTVNWRSLDGGASHLVNVNAGWDNATTFGAGYGYRMNSKLPLIIGGSFSAPTGENLVDDFKTKIGAQAEVFRYNSFSATVKADGIFRRYESEFVTLANFGSEFSTALGYYKAGWYAAAEFGFDKAIVTHVKHSALMEEYNPEIKSGWYIPTGGNFLYGIQAGFSVKSYDLYLRAGKTIQQDLKTTSVIPFYANVGITKRF